MLHARPGQAHAVRDVRHVQGCAGRRQGIQHRCGQLPQARQTRDGPHVPVEDHCRHPPPVQRGQEVARSWHPEKGTDHWAPRTRKRHQQEHRPQRPTERSDPTQHVKGRMGDCPGPRKGATTRRNVTRGVWEEGRGKAGGRPGGLQWTDGVTQRDE